MHPTDVPARDRTQEANARDGATEGRLRVRERTAELQTLLEWMRFEEAERRRTEEAERRRGDQLQRFEAALLALVTTPRLELTSALRQATHVVAETLEVESVAVWLFDEAATELRCREEHVRGGNTHPCQAIVRAADHPCFFSELARRMNVAVSEVAADQRTRELASGPLGGFAALLAVPIRLGGELAGILMHGSNQRMRAWSQAEQDFAMAAAGLVALALEADQRRRVEAQLHALAAHLESVREDERAGLARELHDELGQLLTALRMDTAWLGRASRDQPEKFTLRAPERLEGMKKLIDEAIGTVQRVASDLRPGALRELGLVDALERQAQEFEERSGIVCSFHPPDEAIAPEPAQAVAVYRAMQEALTNVARHAGASAVETQLALAGGHFVLSVQDDGCGLPADAPGKTSSLGLTGLRERALALGGTVRFEAPPGQGTRVVFRIPVQPPSA